MTPAKYLSVLFLDGGLVGCAAAISLVGVAVYGLVVIFLCLAKRISPTAIHRYLAIVHVQFLFFVLVRVYPSFFSCGCMMGRTTWFLVICRDIATALSCLFVELLFVALPAYVLWIRFRQPRRLSLPLVGYILMAFDFILFSGMMLVLAGYKAWVA